MNKIDKLLTKLIEKNKTPSVQYLLFDKNSIIHQFQKGFADIKNKKEVGDHTTYYAFSVTKTFTALAILQLAEKGKFDIDESVSQYLSDFPYSKNITIRHLMAHSAGIPNPNPLSWIHLKEEHDAFDSNEFFDQIFKKYNQPKSNPNEKFSYSNLGYVLLGKLIEKISGQKYEEYIHDNIIQPLGLSSKELDFKIFDESQQAKGYQKKLSLLNWVLGFFIDKKKYMNKAVGNWKPFKFNYVNGASYGGLIGTSNAFAKYVQELLKSDCLIISDTYKKMLFNENVTNSNKPTGMCLSWFKGYLNDQEYFTHAGGGGGYYCEIRIYPARGIGSVIMFNRSGISDERFLDKVDRLYFEK